MHHHINLNHLLSIFYIELLTFFCINDVYILDNFVGKMAEV